ncbi:MAG: hypothetical protein BGO43_08140 [Gammaproteobacteria bacterium 39-13]|nr:DUF1841 family protein [Gammaproteobacteria bacterium]OJV91641.1 MAG: hypothetical protein BGO43_08140 [Gammaproteobacteria bacterium 39-13]
MVDQDPTALRKVYFDAWQKTLQNLPLTPMEAIISDIIKRHPEYQPIFSDPENFNDLQNEKFALDHNPFFHLGLHVTIAEQVGANRPLGIRPLYQRLLKKYGDQNQAEHKMMECLARILVDSFQQSNSVNEKRYLEAIRRLL